MNKILILSLAFVFVSLLVIGSLIFFNGETSIEKETNENNLYQGPVQQGVDIQHFRETGETKNISLEDGK